MSGIRGVLFDLDGTLYRQTPLRLLMAAEMSLATLSRIASGGARVPRVIATFRRARERLRLDERRSSATSPQARVAVEPLATLQYTIAAQQLGCSPDEVARVVDEWMYRRPLKWLRSCRRRGARALLQALEQRGLACGVLSDYPPADKLTALGLRSHFDLLLSAVDPAIDVLKPHPRGLLAAASAWHLRSAEVLYVGDRMDVDAVAARAANMPCAIIGAGRSAPREGGMKDGGTAPAVFHVRGFAELQHVIERLS